MKKMVDENNTDMDGTEKDVILEDRNKITAINPFQLFQNEFPELAGRFNDLVDAQRSLKGMDPKTKQLVNIAIQTANCNPMGVKMHAQMAKSQGASRDEILGAVVMNLHLSGLSNVLDCLPAALEGLESVKK
ncbi:MAG: carboxymuconolactone decarboxylase family protein [Methanobacterium formicicum]